MTHSGSHSRTVFHVSFVIFIWVLLWFGFYCCFFVFSMPDFKTRSAYVLSKDSIMELYSPAPGFAFKPKSLLDPRGWKHPHPSVPSPKPKEPDLAFYVIESTLICTRPCAGP